MIYSAPGTGVHPFNSAWVFGSKLGLAVSERPDGGFRQLGFFYNQDGFAADTSSWDAQSTSNPHVRKFGNKYYLYYAATVDPAMTMCFQKQTLYPKETGYSRTRKSA